MALPDKERWTAVFKDLDKDGSGCINLRELKEICGDETVNIFSEFDDDGDKTISLQEFLEEMCKPVLEQQFQELDADGSGYLEEGELKQMLQSLNLDDETIQKCLDSCDHDGDGKVSYKELHKVIYQE